jgi:hypothetical protein
VRSMLAIVSVGVLWACGSEDDRVDCVRDKPKCAEACDPMQEICEVTYEPGRCAPVSSQCIALPDSCGDEAPTCECAPPAGDGVACRVDSATGQVFHLIGY